MTAGSGGLDRRITIERDSGSTTNGFNEKASTWLPHTTVWARKMDASDGEKVAAGQTGSSVMSRFRVRSSTKTRDITPRDRIVFDGNWNILGIKETQEGRKRFLEITAVTDTDS